MRFALLLIPLALVGCGGETPSDVSGTVTLTDGTPLPDGEIIFLAADGDKTPEAGPIKDGKYALKVLPGPKKVQVRASRRLSKPDKALEKALGDAAREPMLGPEYNEQTTLTWDIKPGDNPGVDFKVKALPKGK